MINLSNFSDLVPKSGRGSVDCTYITITDSRCHIILSKKDYEQVSKYIGSTVNIKCNDDLSILVLMKGGDRRVGSTNRDISVVSLKDRLKAKFGDAIRTVYFDCAWDEDETGRKVFVLRHNNRKEYAADATTYKLRG